MQVLTAALLGGIASAGPVIYCKDKVDVDNHKYITIAEYILGTDDFGCSYSVFNGFCVEYYATQEGVSVLYSVEADHLISCPRADGACICNNDDNWTETLSLAEST